MVCVAALNAASLAVMGAPEHFKHHWPLFLPAVIDRLGDLKQPVRDAGRKLLLALMAYQVANPADLIGKNSNGWKHKAGPGGYCLLPLATHFGPSSLELPAAARLERWQWKRERRHMEFL
jgi:hypothetical protein